MINKKAPEGMWYTQVGTPFIRLFVKALFLKDESRVSAYELWTDEQKKEYLQSQAESKPNRRGK